ncbi:MAG: Transketolase C-terminal subunit (tktA, tktB) [Cenarchaeum symbiont of Oopsacas minuta]|nr:Transketolase C-terminal subunit (tktA, tktB) [Cenarchaeum symbiont of Oopsacas minuta]
MISKPQGDMRSAYGDALLKLGELNPNVVVLGADTTDSLKTSGFGKKYPERFFNVGIAEANMVSIAAGLAISGKTAFASTYAIFLPGRAVDQIRNAVCYPTRPDKKGLDVKLAVSHGGLSVGADGGSHQQLEDLAIMRSIPHMRVFMPADSVSVSAMTCTMASTYGPFYMRMARSKTPIIHQNETEFVPGGAITLRDGSDCTIAACGITVSMALDAAESLALDGISCRVLDVYSIKPINVKLLEKAARETGRIVTCEEHNIMGGFGSAVTESVAETYPVPIKRLGVQDSFGESCRDSEMPQLLAKHGITSLNIAHTIKELQST